MNIPVLSNEWFERLADITECSPDWLKGRISIFTKMDDLFPDEVLPSPKKETSDLVFFVHPVKQKDSGVVQVIE